MSRLAGSLDANVLLRLLLNDVPDQHAAALSLLETSPAQFAVADTAVIEVAFVLERHYQFSRRQIREAIDGLLSLTELNCNRALFKSALSIFAKHASLSFEDCCLASYAVLNQAEPLWTFDRELAAKVSSVKRVPAARRL